MQKEKFSLNNFRVEGIMCRDAPALYDFDKDPRPRDRSKDRTKTQMWLDKIDLVDTISTDELADGPLVSTLAMATNIFGKSLAPPVAKFKRFYTINSAMPFLRAEIDAYIAPTKKTKGYLARVVRVSTEEFLIVGRQGFPRKGISYTNWIELQHQMAVTGMTVSYLVATVDGTSVRAVEIQKDLPFTSNHIAECVLFWDYIRRGAKPPGVVAGDTGHNSQGEIPTKVMIAEPDGSVKHSKELHGNG